ncbi:hypothetical protein HX837_02490 [Marine Group I thaumarchaeote]|uniref:Uncharacterized protein n=1 Tax=Marine Group I thaumarchaeote TaxID=2511932 RepID=A0A7K4MNC3_9ARCH|nr:hypothetical protein [Marine Group I thaumarchaeote]
MKKFTIALLGVIFVTLIAGSVQSVTADHLEPGQGIFKEKSDVELVTTHGSNYQIYLQTVFRNGDDQLINVSETTEIGMYIPHKITDHVFDTLMGKKEIIAIDNIKYEKVQYIFSPTLEHRWAGFYPIFSEIPLEFKYGEDAVAKMNKKIKNYSIWKIHYCAAFEGHGYTCIPVFQTLVPTMTLEPDDVVTQQWTVLRAMN